MTYRINIRQMEAFRAVMLTGAITQASKVLNLTQPAISRLIKDLETNLGVPLFVRRNGKLQPLNAAKWLLRESEGAMLCLDQLDTVFRNIGRIQRKELHLLTTAAVADGILPEAIRTFRDAHPDVSVSVQVAVRRETGIWTSAQRFDLAVAIFPIEYPEEAKRSLIRVPGVAVLPKGHPLKRKKVLFAKDFDNENLVTFLPETLNRFQLDQILDRHGTTSSIAVETQTISALSVFVAAGVGLAITDPFTALSSKYLGIEIRPFEPEIKFDFGFLYPMQKRADITVETFIPHVRASVEKTVDWYEEHFPGWRQLTSLDSAA